MNKDRDCIPIMIWIYIWADNQYKFDDVVNPRIILQKAKLS